MLTGYLSKIGRMGGRRSCRYHLSDLGVMQNARAWQNARPSQNAGALVLCNCGVPSMLRAM